MKYEIESGTVVGEFAQTEPTHEMWDIAKKMRVGDCITFDRKNPEEMNDMRMLKTFLYRLHGTVYKGVGLRPYTQKSSNVQTKVWRVDVQEKIAQIEAHEKMIKEWRQERFNQEKEANK